MRACGKTDVGLRRHENQDTFAVEQGKKLLIAVVCDGMGGAEGGQIASSVAVETFMKEMRALIRADMTAEQLRELASFCVAKANTAVYQRALQDPAYQGMGTTLVAAFVLLYFGTGPVRGFAVTLAIGIATSMFTSVTVTRLIITGWLQKYKPTKLPI